MDGENTRRPKQDFLAMGLKIGDRVVFEQRPDEVVHFTHNNLFRYQGRDVSMTRLKGLLGSRPGTRSAGRILWKTTDLKTLYDEVYGSKHPRDAPTFEPARPTTSELQTVAFSDPDGASVRLDETSSEGRKLLMTSFRAERDPELSRKAKDLNRRRNDGRIVCEGCGLTDDCSCLFDAHHLKPIAAGETRTHVSDLAVLCPTCHRWAHCKAPAELEPLPIPVLRSQRMCAS